MFIELYLVTFFVLNKPDKIILTLVLKYCDSYVICFIAF
jgi:hypothetical protein